MNNKHTPQSNHAKQQECSAKDSESVPKQSDELQTMNNEAIYVSYKESHTKHQLPRTDQSHLLYVRLLV